MFATGFLILAACLLAQVIVGDDVWNRSAWRRYFFPGLGFVMGLAMWAVAVLAGGSMIHLIAHFAWAQVMMLAGGAHLGLARGKLRHRSWCLTMPLALGVSGLAFLAHEQHGWLYSRSALVHHVCGWTLVVGALFPLGAAFRPRSHFFRLGFAVTFVVLAVALFALRDSGPALGNVPSIAAATRAVAPAGGRCTPLDPRKALCAERANDALWSLKAFWAPGRRGLSRGVLAHHLS